MLFLLNGDGTMTRIDSGRIFQGSNNFTELGVVYPFSGVTLSVAFTLPNGIDTDYTVMPPLEPFTLRGNNGETKGFENLYYTSVRIPSTVTARQGSVKVSVLATAAADVGGETDATQGTSYAATFTVEYAALPVYTVPDDPTEEDFQKLVEIITAYQGTITGNVTELQERMAEAEADIDELQENMGTAQEDISDLKQRMEVAEGEIDQAQEDIADLQPRMEAAEGEIGDLQSRMETAEGEISDLRDGKQDKEDNALETPTKTVVGAINELYTELTDTTGDGFASRLDTAEAEISVLDSRLEDVEEKTKDPLMTDVTVDVATSTMTKYYNDGSQADISLPTGDTAERINFLTSVVFTEEQWAEQEDLTYRLDISAAQTGRTNNKYVANLEVTDGSEQVVSADKFIKNEDGSITLKDFTEPWSGRIITVAAGQHGSIAHFGTAVTGTGTQTSADLDLRAAAMIGDSYINRDTFEYYLCTAVSTTTSTWEYQGTSLGRAATVEAGTTTTGAEGTEARVENVGTEYAAVLNFTIPRGNTGEQGVGVARVDFEEEDAEGGNVYRITLTDGTSYTFTAPRGRIGATGATGEGFSIYKTYASVEDMNADAENVPDGKFVLIATNAEDPDNAALYVRTTAGEEAFDFIVDMSGATGIQGEAATIEVGSVTSGATARVTNSGTEQKAVFDFVLPKGEDGAAATVEVGEVTTLDPEEEANVTNRGSTSAAVLDFAIPRGKDGTDGGDGTTFTPSVDTNGNLSWTNDGGLENPATVNIRGAQGEAATVEVGTTRTLEEGSAATVNNSGTSLNAVLNFGIPKGDTGEAATVEVDSVETLEAGSDATVENVGTANAARLKFGIPRGVNGVSPELKTRTFTLLELSTMTAGDATYTELLGILQKVHTAYLDFTFLIVNATMRAFVSYNTYSTERTNLSFFIEGKSTYVTNAGSGGVYNGNTSIVQCTICPSNSSANTYIFGYYQASQYIIIPITPSETQTLTFYYYD